MTPSEKDIKLWLERALIKENLVDFSINILGHSGQDDGFTGTVIFVEVSGKANDNSLKNYDVVLKCGTQIQRLRENIPIKQIYENEGNFYGCVVPAFAQFQREKCIEEPFNSVAKCYATLIDENSEVIVLENLKMKGYTMHDSKKPFSTNHLKLLLEQYAKFHAISAAMQNQQPDKFQQILDKIKNVFLKMAETLDFELFFGNPIDDISELLKDELTEYHTEKLKLLKKQILYIIKELIRDTSRFATICHGDCWNNNFMFQYKDESEKFPSKVAMLDWQAVRYCHPVTDLSLLIYTSVSKEDLNNFDNLLKFYYDHFSNYVKKLGSDPETIYSFSRLKEDWKIYGKLGVMMAFLNCKNALSDKSETMNVAEADLIERFSYEIKDKVLVKNRILHIVDHAIERDII